MRGSSLNPGMIASGGSGYDSATTALLAAMTVQPSSTLAGKIDTLIRGLKTTAHSSGGGATLWSKIDRFHRFDVHDRQAAHLDWKTPATKYVLELGGTITGSGNASASDQLNWTASQGFNQITAGGTGSQTTASGLSIRESMNAGSNFTQNDAYFAVDLYAFAFRNYSSLVQESSVAGTAFNALLTQGGGNYFIPALNDADQGQTVPADATVGNWKRRMSLVRTDASTLKFYRNGTLYSTNTVSSSATNLGSNPCKLMWGDKNFFVDAPDSGTIMSGFACGAAMTAADLANINTLLIAFAGS